WYSELDLRSITSTMPMRELRCKTPESVRKEVWAHVLADNLIRTVMAQAAVKHGVVPRSISFKGALRTLEAFQPLLQRPTVRDAGPRPRPGCDRLGAVGAHRGADRPDRFEPRVTERRRNHYGWRTQPRAEMKRQMAKGVTTDEVPFGDAT